MEQGRTAGDIFILQLQAGDLVAAAIINALERVTLNVDDRAAGLGFKPAQIDRVRSRVHCSHHALIGTSRVHFDEFLEIVDTPDQERFLLRPLSFKFHFVDGYFIGFRMFILCSIVLGQNRNCFCFPAFKAYIFREAFFYT